MDLVLTTTIDPARPKAIGRHGKGYIILFLSNIFRRMVLNDYRHDHPDVPVWIYRENGVTSEHLDRLVYWIEQVHLTELVCSTLPEHNCERRLAYPSYLGRDLETCYVSRVVFEMIDEQN